jgi:hypothetical protein
LAKALKLLNFRAIYAPTPMSSAILADLYGVRLVGVLYGWTYLGHQIGGWWKEVRVRVLCADIMWQRRWSPPVTTSRSAARHKRSTTS